MRLLCTITILLFILHLNCFAPNCLQPLYIYESEDVLADIKAKTITAIIKVEKPNSNQAALAAWYREGALGLLQIRVKVIIDVNSKVLKRNIYSLDDCSDSLKSVKIFLLYQSLYNPKFDVYKAAMIWNGGPTWYKANPAQKKRLAIYWNKVKNELNRI